MAMTSVLVVVYYLFALCIPTGLLCILQYVLSKLESSWPGRVLPILSGLFSLMMTAVLLLNMVYVGGGGVRFLLTAVLMLLLLNIPTVLYIVIYRNTRRKYRTQKDMDKMSIQDLE